MLGNFVASQFPVSRIVLVACLGIVIALMGNRIVEHRELSKAMREFDRIASRHAADLQRRIAVSLVGISSIKGLFAASRVTSMRRRATRPAL